MTASFRAASPATTSQLFASTQLTHQDLGTNVKSSCQAAKVLVRTKLLQPGYDVPPDNILVVYLHACEAHGVTANSGVAEQLLRRVRVLQPVPLQRVVGLSREQLLAAARGHLSAIDGQYDVRAIQRACALLNPRASWADVCTAVGLSPPPQTSGPPPQALWPAAALDTALRAVTEFVEEEELRCGVAEVLARPLGHSTLDTQRLLMVLFDHMDVDSKGHLPAWEVRQLVAKWSPRVDMAALAHHFHTLMRPDLHVITWAEFSEIFAYLAAALAPLGASPQEVRDKTEITVNSLLDTKLRDGYVYDFSRTYLGAAGVAPLMEALEMDPSFTTLGLAHCGVCDSAVLHVEHLAKVHPHLIALDLSHNPLGDSGGAVLVRLLQFNPRIVHLDITGTHLLRRFSRTHHNALGPSVCEDGQPVFEALAANRASQRASPAATVRALRLRGHELRTLVAELADAKGRAVLDVLQDRLAAAAKDWGLEEGHVRQVIASEHLLGTSAAVRSMDDSGRLGVTYDELMHFLRAHDAVVRVARAVLAHHAQVKRIFYDVADVQLSPQVACRTVSPYMASMSSVDVFRPITGTPNSSHDMPPPALPADRRNASPAIKAVYGELAQEVQSELFHEARESLRLAPTDPPGPTQADAGVVPATLHAARALGGVTGIDGFGAGPLAELPSLLAALVAAAEEAGSGWDVSVADLRQVLVPELFRSYLPSASVHPAGVGMVLSWTQFFYTLMHLHQR